MPAPSRFTLVNKKRAKISGALFRRMAEAILGKDYELSVAIVGPGEMERLNKMYRKLDKPTDILSFPLGKKQGQIFLCVSEARKEAKNFDRELDNFLSFLFIHGCVHLKGHDHGSTMERIEKKFRKQFGI